MTTLQILVRRWTPVVAAVFIIAGCATEGAGLASDEVIAARPLERVFGTNVWLIPPPDYARADSFTGYANLNNGASIVVTQLDVPADAMLETMTEENLATRGIQIKTRQDVLYGPHSGIAMRGTQYVSGFAAFKFMGVFGTDERTLMVVASAPGGISDRDKASLRESVLTARFRSGSPLATFEGLNYRFEETDRLAIASRQLNSLTLSARDAPGSSKTIYPFMVIGPSLGRVAPQDLESLARQRVLATIGIEEISNVRHSVITVDGHDLHEIHATAVDVDSGEAVTVYQGITMRDSYYYLLQGFTRSDQADVFVPDFETVARSLTIDRSN